MPLITFSTLLLDSISDLEFFSLLVWKHLGSKFSDNYYIWKAKKLEDRTYLKIVHSLQVELERDTFSTWELGRLLIQRSTKLLTLKEAWSYEPEGQSKFCKFLQVYGRGGSKNYYVLLKNNYADIRTVSVTFHAYTTSVPCTEITIWKT